MTTARDVMTADVDHLTEDDTLTVAAERMAAGDVGALPVCSSDQRLIGVVTDRDIVVKALAQGRDPSTVRAGELVQGEAVTIGADDSLDEARRVMAEHQVRRLPVIDGDRLVGIVSQADVAKHLSPDQIGHLLEAISAAPAN